MWIKATFIVFVLSMLASFWYILRMEELRIELSNQRAILKTLQGTTMQTIERLNKLE